MADTLREVTIGRGHDPRDFVLFAYGGAGPAHCSAIGAELGVPRIVVPGDQHGAFRLWRARLRHSAIGRTIIGDCAPAAARAIRGKGLTAALFRQSSLSSRRCCRHEDQEGGC